jgi:hypothetical protein
MNPSQFIKSATRVIYSTFNNFFFLLNYFAFNYTTKNLKIKNKHDMRVGFKKKHLTNKGFFLFF